MRNLDLCDEFYGGVVPAAEVRGICTCVRNFMEVQEVPMNDANY